jgi:hypothetical protein
MAEKEKKTVKPSVKKMVNNILMQHPEVLNNARHLFRNENGRTIVEDRVPRGDVKREDVGQPFCQADLTEADLRDLGKYASDMVDDNLMRYDERTAYEDALHRAIHDKDGGKYSGKVNANTFSLILSTINKPKKSTAKKSYDSSDKSQSSNIPVKEGTMSRAEEIKALETKLANLQKQDTLEKVADILVDLSAAEREQFKATMKAAAEDKKKRGGNQNDPKTWQTTMDSIGVSGKKASDESEKEHKDTPAEAKKEEKAVEEATGKKHDESEKGHEEKETAKEKKIEEEKVHKDEKKEDKDATVIEELDKIAGELESSKDFELFKIAYQLDTVADVLEGKKVATALESEPDEKYMREAFNWTIHQKDADEKYMNSFSTDKTQEIEKAYSQKPYGVVKL